MALVLVPGVAQSLLSGAPVEWPLALFDGLLLWRSYPARQSQHPGPVGREFRHGLVDAGVPLRADVRGLVGGAGTERRE
jgi:hypothetical protein